MSRQELLAAIEQLPLAERLSLIEAVTRRLREEIESTSRGTVELAGESVAVKLRGAFKASGEPPTDEEMREDYTNYLMEKYS